MVPNEEFRQFKFSWYKTSEQVYDLSNHVTTPPEFDDDRSWMCSFQIRDRMIMIGGNEEKEYRQFRVNPHSMSVDVLADLPFPFNYGSCHEYNDDFALACAGSDNKEHCWELSGATDKWTQVGDTTYDHYSGDLAKFKKSAVIVGGFSDTHGATEIFDPIQKAGFHIILTLNFLHMIQTWNRPSSWLTVPNRGKDLKLSVNKKTRHIIKVV